MKEFEGKVALVTGGGSGIGRATAVAFAREGAHVVIGNRNVELGEETVSMIRETGGNARFQRTDVMVAADVGVDRACYEDVRPARRRLQQRGHRRRSEAHGYR